MPSERDSPSILKKNSTFETERLNVIFPPNKFHVNFWGDPFSRTTVLQFVKQAKPKSVFSIHWSKKVINFCISIHFEFSNTKTRKTLWSRIRTITRFQNKIYLPSLKFQQPKFGSSKRRGTRSRM